LSNLSHELFVGATPEELKAQTNAFMAQPNIEVKQFDYETNGYEKPYSASILYHDKDLDDQAGLKTWKREVPGRS